MGNIDRDPQTYTVVGLAMAVHRELGSGFLEAVYQEALAFELARSGIPFVREVSLPVVYRGHRLPIIYRADFVCFDEIIVELKAIHELTKREPLQVLNYLKASGKKRGLLLNFGSDRLQVKRLINGPQE